MAQQEFPVHGEITGPIVMIGFGSIGRGTLPLIERHFKFDKSRIGRQSIRATTQTTWKSWPKYGVRHIKAHVTKENYKELLKPLLTEGEGQGFCVNLIRRHRIGGSDQDVPQADVLIHRHRTVETVARLLISTRNEGIPSSTILSRRNPAPREKEEPPAGQRLSPHVGPIGAWSLWFVKQALVKSRA